MTESQHWRRPVAVLADASRRLLYARLVVATADGRPGWPTSRWHFAATWWTRGWSSAARMAAATGWHRRQ